MMAVPVAMANQSQRKIYECRIFRALDGTPAEGSLTVSAAENPNKPYFDISFSENDNVFRNFEGELNVVATMKFSALDSDVQDAITNFVNSSYRSKIESDNFFVFSSDNKRAIPLKVFLPCNGDLGYLQVGDSEVLCR